MKKFQLQQFILLAAVLFTSSLFAQDWVKMMQDPTVNFFDVQKAFNQYYTKAEKKIEREKKENYKMQATNRNEEEEMEVPGTSIYKRWEWFQQPRVSSTGERFSPDAAWRASEQYKKGFQTMGTKGAGNWTEIGPKTSSGMSGAGRLNTLRINPGNANTLYVCSPAGGLWTSTNGGSSWSVMTDQLPQVIGCTDLAFDPTNSNTMYLATGDGEAGDNYSVGLLKSTDGGVTWNATGLSFNPAQYRLLSRVIVDPTNGNNIYVATSAGIYKSTNAASTFTQVLAGSFKSMELKPGTPSTIYCCGTEFYYSTNSGSTWTKATGFPAAASLSRLTLAVSAASATTVYVNSGLAAPNYGEDGFYKSTNSGVSFTKVSTPSGFGNQEWYDLPVAANPSNASEVMIGGQTIFYKSTNGGTSWSQIASTTHVDYHGITYDATTPTTVYICSDGGVYKSTNGGTSWSNSNNNLAIAEIYGFGQSTSATNPIITGHQDNGTNIWNGTSFNATMGGDGMLAFISWSNSNTMWGSQYNGSLNKSTNGGGSWSTMSGITETCPWVTEWNEDPITGGTAYAGCANVWKASGTTFTKLTGNLAGTSTVTITSIGVSPANNQTIWAAKGGTLYKTTNGGGSWSAISSLPSGTISDIVCHNTDVNKAWVSYSGYSNSYKVYETTNGGTSWTNLSASLPNVPMNCMAFDKNSNDGIYVGTDIGVFYKDATMTVWQPFYNQLPNVVVSQIEMYYTGSKIRCSTYGRGVWESTLYTPGAYAPMANFGADKYIGCPSMGVQFTDYSAYQPTSWSWSFPGGTPSTSTQQNPFVVYNTPGTYNVSLTVTNANGSDTKTVNTYITVSTSPYAAPSATGKNFCAPSTVTLNATPAAPGTVRWWDQPAGGNLLGTGNTYTTPTLTTTTTYYVDESFPSGSSYNVGELDNTIGAGAMFTANDIRGLYFDVTKPVIINSVQVYCNSTGVRTIEIIDANGNLVTDTTLNINAAPSTLQTVTINRTVYPGTSYFIKFRGTVDCYRNSAGAVYPYTSPDINITNSNAGLPGYYYFFYNWTYTEIVCNTARTSVTVTDTCLTGMNDLFANNYMDVYPNPSNGVFNVAFHIDNTDNYVIKVANAVGQTVYEEKLENFSGTYSNKINLASMRKGVYLLSVSNSKNQSVKKVLIY
ncbi:MAG: T9SS type A sorting domain-containing protein [Bacteroidetes bacterium]|nr:T9SS type A sorting domain-containing protein [Bacteroidota bacterium]